MNSLDLGGKGENPVRNFIGYDDEYVNPNPIDLFQVNQLKIYMIMLKKLIQNQMTVA